jgi:predicted nucleic acid-binding protein
MSVSAYIDTSALAKWYLNEPNSDEFVSYLKSLSRAVISGLTITEMRSLLSRRRRMQELSPSLEEQLFSTFLMDIDQGFLIVEPMENHYFEEATHLIAALPDIPLRTLDALHLAIVAKHHINILASADQAMIAAAKALKLQVKSF